MIKHIFVMLALCSALASAIEYHVATNGSDAAKGLADSPFRTIGNGEVGAYWHDLWAKSYLEIETPDHTTGFRLTQAYVLQRWVEKPAISSEVKHKLIVKK